MWDALSEFPYYRRVPKGLPQNLRYRSWVMERTAESRQAREDAWVMAARDPYWYWNTFGFILEPRNTDKPTTVPFVTWARQDEILLEVLNAVQDGYDLHIKKSRGVGVSWNVLLVFEWFWHFQPQQHLLVHSRKEELVDKEGDPDTLFYKLSFWRQQLPAWLRPRLDRRKNHLGNIDTGGTIDGGSTTDDIGRGGRRRAIFCDEFAAVLNAPAIVAAVSDTTNCTIYGSTSKGIGTEFHRLESAPICHVETLWHEYPVQSKGLYRVKDGQVEVLDKTCKTVRGLDEKGKIRTFRFPEEYPFVTEGMHFTEGGYRSPYYDQRCAHFTDPALRAQELDLDDIGAGDPFFSRPLIEPLKARATEPIWTGDIERDEATNLPRKPYVLSHKVGGPLKLWWAPDSSGKMPEDQDYCWGADIAQGSGATNSVIIIVNRATGEQVGEYCAAEVTPTDLAYFANALGRIFCGERHAQAYGAWEANGPGNAFGKKLYDDLKYRRIYFRETRDVRRKTTWQPGFHSTSTLKYELFSRFRDALKEATFVIRSRTTLQDCYNYRHDGRGGIVNQLRPTGRLVGGSSRYSHGDFAAAAACTTLGLGDILRARDESRPRKVSVNCLASRIEAARKMTTVASIDRP